MDIFKDINETLEELKDENESDKYNNLIEDLKKDVNIIDNMVKNNKYSFDVKKILKNIVEQNSIKE